MRGKKGISYAAGLATAFIVCLAIALIAVYNYGGLARAVVGGLKAEEAAEVEKLSEDLSVVYWVGDRLVLKNDGRIPVRIIRLYADSGVYDVDRAINPGEKTVILIPQSDELVVQTERGNLIKLKHLPVESQPGSPGGSGGARVEIVSLTAQKIGNNLVKITTWIENTGNETLRNVCVVYVGEAGKTNVEPEDWIMRPGDKHKDVVVLSISEFGHVIYVRTVGYAYNGGYEVSDSEVIKV